ncbi:MAG: HD domain-containing protein [Alphaproteobacteria bacterium]|jgi:predicted HD phosphohydrolase|nr:HD domain-containing protein [Rhodospirillaceae bacterium]MBT6513003.1 HD domain-containing protein [Rhodospirillaceae bacterium]MBT7615048.1 HD domain-containing protein [Rhodospirillaceae bacterium]MBT7647980.1 HD domain-containing protein [Rhodospirillaceae bacterium]MDG2482155.1 HD domain-containing protein [Alphaproteobacteria bacterium]
MEKVSFAHMEDGTADDYRIIGEAIAGSHHRLAGELLTMLKATESAEQGIQVTRYEHALQTATLAFKDGQDEDMVVAALMHDIADNISPYNHAEVGAAILKPYVSEKAHWVVKYHGLFQTYYYAHFKGGDRLARDKHKGHPHYQACIDFCAKYDQMAFDPDYSETMPLEAFEPMVHRIFSRTPNFDMATKDEAA